MNSLPSHPVSGASTSPEKPANGVQPAGEHAAPARPQASASSAVPVQAGEGLPKQYRPEQHEGRIRERWDRSGVFHADPARVLSGERKPFCVLIPPPNVTGALHLGHALNNTIQDILTRSHRMKGFEALWMPGTDHAGIATQAVVERRLLKEQGKRRTDYSREEFVGLVQAWKDEYEARITSQLKAMGCSCDFGRQRFTMDAVCAGAVREGFFRLFRDGLIYRGKRLVNWDPVLQTAVADDECYDEDVDAAFYSLRYPLVRVQGGADPGGTDLGGTDLGGTDLRAVPVTWSELARAGYPGAEDHPADAEAWVTVATTRPETYLGDTAVALNPHDPRAGALRGLHARLPLVGRVIPIVEDGYVVLPKALARSEEEAADPKAEFATGFLKVTPAHDANDYDLYQRHKGVIDANSAGNGLINMMSPDGRVSDKHGWGDVGDAHIFVGKTMSEARKLVVREFDARGLFEGQRAYRHSVKHSDRSKAVIEPYLSDQWYVRVTDERMAGWANRALVTEQRGNEEGTEASRHRGIEAGSRIGAPTDCQLRFHPPRYAKTYETWHDNIRDWCISRQLWWGHRIPVWTISAATERSPAHHKLLEEWMRDQRICVNSQHSIPQHSLPGHYVCVRNGEDTDVISELVNTGYTQDPDVLDTWFSSALWPLSTLGWPDPEQSTETRGLLDAFNPTTVLSTAREIITLWVSRMVMFNRYFRGSPIADSSLPSVVGQASPPASTPSPASPSSSSPQVPGPVPFRDVFIHAVVQDGDGKRMSKSAGNGVDPLDIIASHGADALRFTLTSMVTQTQDVRMPVALDPGTGRNTSPKFDLGRNFCNKLWNASRFAMGMLGQQEGSGQGQGEHGPEVRAIEVRATSLPDRWLLSRLVVGLDEIERCLREYDFAGYAQAAYDLLWRDFCDWYLEAIKPTVGSDPSQRATLRTALDVILRLLHPIIPFITEAIHEHLRTVPATPLAGVGASTDELLCASAWPVLEPGLRDVDAEARFELVRGLVTAIREVRAQHEVPPKRRVTLHASGHGGATAALLDRLGPDGALVQSLAGVDKLTREEPGAGSPSVVLRFEGLELRVSNLADAVDAGAERERLTRRRGELEKSIAAMLKRLESPGYTERAPAKLVEETRLKLAKEQEELAAVTASLGALGG